MDFPVEPMPNIVDARLIEAPFEVAVMGSSSGAQSSIPGGAPTAEETAEATSEATGEASAPITPREQRKRDKEERAALKREVKIHAMRARAEAAQARRDITRQREEAVETTQRVPADHAPDQGNGSARSTTTRREGRVSFDDLIEGPGT